MAAETSAPLYLKTLSVYRQYIDCGVLRREDRELCKEGCRLLS